MHLNKTHLMRLAVLQVALALLTARADEAEPVDAPGDAIAVTPVENVVDTEADAEGEPVTTDYPGYPEAMTPANAYIYCSAQIYTPGETLDAPDPYLSIEIPVHIEDYGVPLWNIGQIPVGGVADTWYNGGPGYFRIQNTGNVPCYIHVIAATMPEMNQSPSEGWVPGPVLWPTDKTPPEPASWTADEPFWDAEPWYALAVAINVLDVAPRWNVLNQFLPGGMYDGPDGFIEWIATYGRVLGRAQPGENLVFDLKFWAPQNIEYGEGVVYTDPIGRLVRFEAAEFPRWPSETWAK